MATSRDVAHQAVVLARRAIEDFVAFVGPVSDRVLDGALSEREVSLSRDQLADPEEVWVRRLGHMLVAAVQSGRIARDEASAAPDLTNEGWDAFRRGDASTTAQVGDALLRAAAELDRENWNYGNLIHHGHILLGCARLLEGDLAGAESELIAAGRTPGSPQLNSFGPDLSLAWELLHAGKDTAVITYLHDISRFWAPHRGGGTSPSRRPNPPRA